MDSRRGQCLETARSILTHAKAQKKEKIIEIQEIDQGIKETPIIDHHPKPLAPSHPRSAYQPNKANPKSK